MKIFILCNRLGGGGAERVGALLATGFSQKGHQVYIATNLSIRHDYSVDDRVKLLPLFPQTSNKYVKWLGAIPLLRKHIHKISPDVIIGIMGECSLLGRIAVACNNIPVIMTEHYAFERPEYAPLSISQNIWKFYMNRLYSCVTVLTEADKKVIGDRLKRVYVMPNPLALNPYQGKCDKKKKILAVGRLNGWFVKGFDLLIKAWGGIATNYPDWSLEIVGTGNNQSIELLNKLIEECNVKNSVKLIGFQSDIEKMYREASVFVLSSRYEGFGLVLIEAMSQGCACVACDYGGRQREIIINNKIGIICAPDNVSELANAMRQILSDERYRETLQMNAPKAVYPFELTRIIEKWDDLLKIVTKR